jgi:hypothetical protein
MTELDKTRRYLRPVRATVISDDRHGVHFAVYEWLPIVRRVGDGYGYLRGVDDAGPAAGGHRGDVSGVSEVAGGLRADLSPGYRPEDDDPKRCGSV